MYNVQEDVRDDVALKEVPLVALLGSIYLKLLYDYGGVG